MFLLFVETCNFNMNKFNENHTFTYAFIYLINLYAIYFSTHLPNYPSLSNLVISLPINSSDKKNRIHPVQKKKNYSYDPHL